MVKLCGAMLEMIVEFKIICIADELTRLIG